MNINSIIHIGYDNLFLMIRKYFFHSSISGVANYIHKCPLGIMLPRNAGNKSTTDIIYRLFISRIIFLDRP